jgi:predicted O-methyltransferase YrrM
MFVQHIYNQPQFGENWFTYKQLYTDMVRKFPSGSTFVEIGSWKGKSAAYMAVEIANSQKNIEFYCVDTWEGSIEHQNNKEIKNLYDTFLSNIKPCKEYIQPIRSNSLDAINLFENETIDFIFLDASHEYTDIKSDIINWLPKIRKNGILAGHDYQMCFNGVIKAVLETLPKYAVDVHQKCFIYYNE